MRSASSANRAAARTATRFDGEGRLLHCEGAEFGPHGNRRITRTDLKTGRCEVLTEQYEGQRYNARNDICVDGRGQSSLPNPMYWDRTQMEMTVDGVYRIDVDGRVTRILDQSHIDRPNSIAVDARRQAVVS